MSDKVAVSATPCVLREIFMSAFLRWLLVVFGRRIAGNVLSEQSSPPRPFEAGSADCACPSTEVGAVKTEIGKADPLGMIDPCNVSALGGSIGQSSRRTKVGGSRADSPNVLLTKTSWQVFARGLG